MKNKEIEELLKYLKNKFYISGEFYTEEKIKVLSKKELELLLSYIEQLENNRDKAIKYIERLDKDYDINVYQEDKHWVYILYILKGDSK